MKLIRNPWKKTALNRLILSFICILLPLYTLAIVIYSWGIQTLQTEISNSMTSQVSQYFVGLENEFSRIQALRLDYLNDMNLNALAAISESLDSIRKMEKILSLQQLNSIRNSSEYIKEVYTYIPAIQKTISALSVSDLDRDMYVELMNLPSMDEVQVVNYCGNMYRVAAFPYLLPMTRLRDYDQAEQFANQLGEYYQFVTRNHSDEVPPAKEVQHAKVYAEIQEMRFANRVSVSFEELPDDVGHVMVPRLILQPLIENAFEHDLEKKSRDGRLDVRFDREGRILRLIVEDNGEQIDDEAVIADGLAEVLQGMPDLELDIGSVDCMDCS